MNLAKLGTPKTPCLYKLHMIIDSVFNFSKRLDVKIIVRETVLCYWAVFRKRVNLIQLEIFIYSLLTHTKQVAEKCCMWCKLKDFLFMQYSKFFGRASVAVYMNPVCIIDIHILDPSWNFGFLFKFKSSTFIIFFYGYFN